MENNNTPASSSIDLLALVKQLWQSKRLIICNAFIACVLAAVWIFPQPRTYQASVSMAPELENGPSAMGSISSLASSFGVNLGSMTSADAFYPKLYPDIVATNGFLIDILKVRVQTADGDLDTSYYDYLANHQKICIWNMPKRWLGQLIRAIKPKKTIKGAGSGDDINPFCLSEEQARLIEGLRNNILCSTDKETEVISITVIDQDPKVCALMADSVRMHLQKYITKYRTQKARNDMEYYKKLMLDSRKTYDEAVAAYSHFSDSHTDLTLPSFITKRDELENEMQRCYTAYSAFNTQYEAAKGKIQENTPAFTLLEAATMPVKPKGPKRMLFMLCMMILTTLGTSIWVLRKEIFKRQPSL